MSMPKTKAEIQRDYERRSGYAAKAKYDKEKTRHYAIKVISATEPDIIQKLDSVPNKAGYIKRLIRADIAKDQ